MGKSKNKKTILALALILVCIAAIYLVRIYKRFTTTVHATSASNRVKGNPNAVTKIVEYMDFQCGACAQSAEYLKKFFNDKGDQFYLEIKYFPLEEIHQHTIFAARYAECSAQQGKFWPVHDGLFARQKDWHKMINPDSVFREIANNAGVDLKKLDACLDSEAVGEAIAQNKAEGLALGVNSTPSYFVNGKMVVGLKSLEQALTDPNFKDWIEPGKNFMDLPKVADHPFAGNRTDWNQTVNTQQSQQGAPN